MYFTGIAPWNQVLGWSRTALKAVPLGCRFGGDGLESRPTLSLLGGRLAKPPYRGLLDDGVSHFRVIGEVEADAFIVLGGTQADDHVDDLEQDEGDHAGPDDGEDDGLELGADLCGVARKEAAAADHDTVGI